MRKTKQGRDLRAAEECFYMLGGQGWPPRKWHFSQDLKGMRQEPMNVYREHSRQREQLTQRSPGGSVLSVFIVLQRGHRAGIGWARGG